MAHRFGQPPVIGEVLAGILVGPTLFHGAVADHLFPVEVRPSLNALATIGVAVFMFFVGLELDGALIRGKGRAVVTVSLSSITLPFCPDPPHHQRRDGRRLPRRGGRGP